MQLYNLLSGGLKAVDYIIIAALVAIVVAVSAIIIWRKVKGKGSCGCDCGGCPSAKTNGCNGNCGGCNSCPSKKEDKNA